MSRTISLCFFYLKTLLDEIKFKVIFAVKLYSSFLLIFLTDDNLTGRIYSIKYKNELYGYTLRRLTNDCGESYMLLI